MLVKLGIVAAAVAYASVSLAAIDYRQLYNEMYPVNGLKRGVLGLCQAANPTFVRALEQDRIDCYDSMPSSIERAIGWVRTSARLAAMRAPTGVELAEKLMRQAEARIQGMPGGTLLFGAARSQFAAAATAEASAACETAMAGSAAPGSDAGDAGLAESGDDRAATERLARRIAAGDKKLLAELGIAPGTPRSGAKPGGELPVLVLGGPGGPSIVKNAAAADLGGNAPPSFVPGCRGPA